MYFIKKSLFNFEFFEFTNFVIAFETFKVRITISLFEIDNLTILLLKYNICV